MVFKEISAKGMIHRMAKEKNENTEEIMYRKILEWKETHDGKMPKTNANDKYEQELRHEWDSSKLCEIYESYMGVPLGKLPKEYEEYKDMIAGLRKFDQKMRSQYIDPIEFDWKRIPLLKIPVERRKKTVNQCKKFEERENKIYTEIINWMDSHDGQIPRSVIRKKGKILKASEMTEEQKYEKNLRTKWNQTMTCWVFDEYGKKQLSEIPEEFQMYANRVVRLAKYENEKNGKKSNPQKKENTDKKEKVADKVNTKQITTEKEKSQMAKTLMRVCIDKCLQDNAKARKELENLVK